jgi:pantoate--beta-alanine ligase
MSEPLPVVRTIRDLRVQVAAWKAAGESVGMVPTMGALHEGHLSLVTLARSRADRVVASLFVNPTQFAPGEDFEAYPRDEARDAALLAGAGCDLLYAPGVGEMYAQGFSTTVTVAGLSEPLDGAARPHHFAGVATVVSKLILQCGPDVAIFGEKDYQQLQVIRRLVADLDIPVEIVGGPTVRAEDGLALSSRNAYLTPAEREVAPTLHRALAEVARRVRAGGPVAEAEAEAVAALKAAGFGRIDYVEVRGAHDLSRLGPGAVEGEARVLGAAVLGRTRLIDNLAV